MATIPREWWQAVAPKHSKEQSLDMHLQAAEADLLDTGLLAEEIGGPDRQSFKAATVATEGTPADQAEGMESFEKAVNRSSPANGQSSATAAQHAASKRLASKSGQGPVGGQRPSGPTSFRVAD